MPVQNLNYIETACINELDASFTYYQERSVYCAICINSSKNPTFETRKAPWSGKIKQSSILAVVFELFRSALPQAVAASVPRNYLT